jgi:hypothetical protein
MMKAAHTRLGMNGELHIQNMLKNLNFDVFTPEGDFSGDLSVFSWAYGMTFKIEVKTAKKGIDGSYKFCLYREGKTNCKYSDIIALVFYNDRKYVVRFISCDKVSHIKNLKITSHPDKYNGKYSKLWTEHLEIQP